MDYIASPPTGCPRCGTALPSNAPEGLCPRCLGALNFTADTAFTNAASEQKAPPTPEGIGPCFPQLEILECLGRGGMGVVYKARQKSLGRLVALKLLAPEREKDAHFSERFSREAQALAALNHPHIVTIHDFGQSNGYFFLLMEFVDGVNLRELLRARKLTPEEALAIVPPLCEALQFAHERGIVHRDIKPENLLLAKDGGIKVVDFGIAKMLGAEAQAEEEKAAGTPGYMAPEQRKTPQRVDSRADIYSLGVVFYEMLTGELPAGKIVAPSRKVAVDVRIDEVVLRALEKSPDLRWQTAADMRTGVEEAAESPLLPGFRTWPSIPRSRWFLLLLVVVMTVVCGLLAHALFGRFDFAWLIPGIIAFFVLIVFGLLVEKQQKALALPVGAFLCAAVLAMPVLGVGALYLWLRDSRTVPPAQTAHGAFLAPTYPPPPAGLEPSTETSAAVPGIQSPPPVRPALSLTPSVAQPAAEPPKRETPKPANSQTNPFGAADPQSGIPVLSDIPIIGELFTKPADPGITPAERKELEELKREIAKLQELVTAQQRGADSKDTPTVQREGELKAAVDLLRRQMDEQMAELSATASSKRSGDVLKFRIEEAEIRGAAAEKALKRQAELLTQRQISNEAYEKSALELALAKTALRAAQAEWQAATQSAVVPATAPGLPPATAAISNGIDQAGIGVVLREENGSIIIGSILPESAAAKDGSLKPGDEIRSIGGSGDQLVSIAGWKLPDVVARLRGKEGTQVSLFVVRGGVGTIVTLNRQYVPELELGGEHRKDEVAAPVLWELRRYLEGATGAENDTTKFPLLWTPTEPPMIVAAQGQKLTAFKAGQDPGEIVWQSNLDAAVCSAPVRCDKTGRIFFGTEDKQFHALDAHGRRRWSFAKGGKVVTEPVVIGDLVIVGCDGDNGTVYALNAETGVARWWFGALASATSAPAVAAGFVVIGSTDGSAFGLDPQTGDKKWTYHGTSSIKAPIVGSGDLIYLATKGGEIVALDSGIGDTRWSTRLGDFAETEMAIGAGRLFVREGGRVSTLALDSGRLLWQTPPGELVGAPLVENDAVIVAGRPGIVRRFDAATGRVREEWKALVTDNQNPVHFSFGPVSGGGAHWVLDDRGAIWRLGPITPSSDAPQAAPNSFSSPVGVRR